MHKRIGIHLPRPRLFMIPALSNELNDGTLTLKSVLKAGTPQANNQNPRCEKQYLSAKTTAP